MSNPTSNFGWQMPTATDLVTDLPADFEVFGQAVDTDLADLNGGTTGQILSKTSNTDLDFTWVTPNAGDITGVTAGTGISGGGTSGTVTVTNSMATAIDAKGDLIVGTGADAFSRLAVGATNGHVLTVDSAEATGLKYAAVAGGAGNMVQIATGTLSGASVVISGLSSYTDILVFMYGATNNTANGQIYMRLNATSTNHNTRGQRINGVSTVNYLGAMADSDFYLSIGGTVTRTASTNNYLAKLTNCKNAGFTDVDIQATFYDSSGNQALGMAKGIYDKSEAVSSITLRAGGGTWAGGDYYVWGS